MDETRDNGVDIVNSELGDMLREIDLDTFTTLAFTMLARMDDKRRAEVEMKAREITMGLIDTTNDACDGIERMAIASMVVVDFAMSVYLTLDEALTMAYMELEFGGETLGK